MDKAKVVTFSCWNCCYFYKKLSGRKNFCARHKKEIHGPAYVFCPQYKLHKGLKENAMKEEMNENLKIEINNLLWRNLHEDVSLGVAEKIACEIYDKIRSTWEEKEKVNF